MIRALDDGSSPLARGLPARIGRGDHARRIIPARAGFTSENNQPYERTQDHPRSRGVYFSFATILIFVAGSSPLARGLPCSARPAPLTGRIIPARAGFTPDGDGLAPVGGGSSPLARGLRTRLTARTAGTRIIPARAGFTGLSRGPAYAPRDHPRSRGVYRPRATRPAPTRRIIPARAGFTHARAHMHARAQDHPRSRGVYASPCIR